MIDPPELDPDRRSQLDRDRGRLAELIGRLVAMRLLNRQRSKKTDVSPRSMISLPNVESTDLDSKQD